MTTKILRLFSLTFMFMLVIQTSVAQSQPTAASESDEELAKRYFTLGQELYNRSDYAGALVQFEQSYKYAQKPALLFNIARCHESLGHPDEAIEYYERYMATNPPAEERIGARIENLRQLAAQKKAREQAQEQRLEETTQKLKHAEQQKVVVETRYQSRWRGVLGWTLAGTGGALMIVGGVMGGLAMSKATALEQKARDRVEYTTIKDDESRGSLFSTVAITGLAAGGALLVGGATFIYLHYRTPSTERTAKAPALWVSPHLTSNHVGLNAGLRF